MGRCGICRGRIWPWQDRFGDAHYGCLVRREKGKAYDRLWEVLKPEVGE